MSVELPTGLVTCTWGGGTGAHCLCLGRRYTCPRCLRFVPFCCYGADDNRPEVCDACWGQLEKEEEEEEDRVA